MTIQIDLTEELLEKVDAAAESAKKNRVDFLSQMIEESMRRRTIEDKIRRDQESYTKYPQQPDEYEIDEDQIAEVWDMMEAEENESR